MSEFRPVGDPPPPQDKFSPFSRPPDILTPIFTGVLPFLRLKLYYIRKY